MKKKIFNKFLVDSVLILLIFAGSIKIYSRWSFPRISDWNYHELRKIDKNKKEFSFVVFSDNKNSVKTFGKLIEKVNAETALFAVDIGDMAATGRKRNTDFL